MQIVQKCGLSVYIRNNGGARNIFTNMLEYLYEKEPVCFC